MEDHRGRSVQVFRRPIPEGDAKTFGRLDDIERNLGSRIVHPNLQAPGRLFFPGNGIRPQCPRVRCGDV